MTDVWQIIFAGASAYAVLATSFLGWRQYLDKRRREIAEIVEQEREEERAASQSDRVVFTQNLLQRISDLERQSREEQQERVKLTLALAREQQRCGKLLSQQAARFETELAKIKRGAASRYSDAS